MPKPRRIPFDSKSAPGKRSYWLLEFGGRYFCNCPGFDRKERGECPHTHEDRELRRLLNMTTDVAIRKVGTDLIPEGYQPIEVRPPAERLPSAPQYEMMMRIAKMAIDGAVGLLDTERAIPKNIKTPEQAMTVMLAGYELGVPPMTALRRLYIVNGRVELETQLLMGLVKAADPTAAFRFNEYGRDRCSVTLYRQGEEIITVDYTREDAMAAGQLQEKWWTKKVQGQEVTEDKNAYALRPGERWGRAAGNSGKYSVLIQAPSVWTSFTRDMLAYSCVKRCCRLGAPELTNQILPPALEDGRPNQYLLDTVDARKAIAQRAGGDQAADPINPIAAMIVEGKADPGEILSGEAPLDAAEEPQDEPPTQTTAKPSRKAPAPRQAESRASTPTPAPPAEDGPPDPRLIQRINARMVILKDGNDEQSKLSPTAYGDIYRRVIAAGMPAGSDRLDFTKMTAAGAAAAWAIVKPEEPPAPADVPATPEAPEPEEELVDPPADDEAADQGDAAATAAEATLSETETFE